jgi:peptide/nickel transport system substrate-binding protein
VRRAFYQAIDIVAIRNKVMRNGSTPTALLVGPGMNGYDSLLDHRLPYDPAAAKTLLKEAGYGAGFDVGLDCANDRDVAPEELCQTISSMLARVGVMVNVLPKPFPIYFQKIISRQTSFYLAGWLDATFDALNPISALITTKAGGRGEVNFGGYSNTRIDQLVDVIEVESDKAKRQDAISAVLRIYRDDVPQIPLHHQWLAWGMKDSIDVPLSPDNIMKLHLVTVH